MNFMVACAFRSGRPASGFCIGFLKFSFGDMISFMIGLSSLFTGILFPFSCSS